MKTMLKILALTCLILTLVCCASAETAHDCAKDGHKLSEPLSVKEATCSQAGYTGDIYCAFCGTKVVTGQAVDQLAHTPGELSGAYEPTCSFEGYTGEVRCTVCGTVMTPGESIAKLAHTPGDRQGVQEATCSTWGYTGDVNCTVCYETLERGFEIEPLPHTAGDPVDAFEATCTQEGYTGDIYCSVCGAFMTSGESIAKLDHTPGELRDVLEVTCAYAGYTGDTECTVCGKKLFGEPVEKLTHEFDGNECIHCGWLIPGLYMDGEMVFTWDQLVDGGYIEMKEGEVREVQTGLTGLLVFQEGVKVRFECCMNTALTGAYLPASLDRIPNKMFKGCEKLEEVRCFGYMEKIGENAFKECTSLKSFTVPLGVTEIQLGAFKSCTALEEVILCDTVEIIGEEAFYDCTSLMFVELPESLNELGSRVFAGCTAMREILLPEGLEQIGSDILSGSSVAILTYPSTLELMYSQDNDELIFVDMSASAMTSMGGSAFKGSESLQEVILPAVLEKMQDSAFSKCESLRRLELPEGFKEIKDNMDGDFSKCTALTELVWPLSLLDGGTLNTIPNLHTIYYRGTELQWSMTNTKDDYAGVEIVFEYTEE